MTLDLVLVLFDYYSCYHVCTDKYRADVLFLFEVARCSIICPERLRVVNFQIPRKITRYHRVFYILARICQRSKIRTIWNLYDSYFNYPYYFHRSLSLFPRELCPVRTLYSFVFPPIYLLNCCKRYYLSLSFHIYCVILHFCFIVLTSRFYILAVFSLYFLCDTVCIVFVISKNSFCLPLN